MAQRRKASFYVILVLILLAVGGLGLFVARKVGREPARIEPEKLVRVERLDLARSVVATGKIEPVTRVEIKSKASGIILKLPVNVGDRVRQGQVICELDQNDLLPRLRQVQAALGVAEATVKSARADYARTRIEAAGPDIPFLKRDLERAVRLLEGKLIAPNARDDAEKNYEMALNRQAQAEGNLGVADAAITKAQAQVEQSRAQVEQAEEDIRNATIRSPIDGVVLSRDREVGDAVSSILVMGAGATLIMTVGDLSEVYVKGKVDESDIGKVYFNQAARITVESYKNQRFTGKVTKISPMGVEKDNVTTFEVRVSISNESRKLMSDMTANAEIMLDEHRGVLTIPEGAVVYKKDRSTAVEIPDPEQKTGKRRVPVTLGISNGSRTEVLKGLAEGQQVVLQ
jgi:HlyD family secretion protein